MLRISLMVALLLACGGSDATSDPTPSVSEGDETDETDETDEGPAEEARPSNVPRDFALRQGGGPVDRDRDHVERQTSVEPSGNGFALVVRDVPARGEPTEVSRVQIEGADVEPVYQIVTDRREELAAECINPNIRGGTIRSFFATIDGEEVEFRCTNSATPAFEALAEAFDDLVITSTPAH